MHRVLHDTDRTFVPTYDPHELAHRYTRSFRVKCMLSNVAHCVGPTIAVNG